MRSFASWCASKSPKSLRLFPALVGLCCLVPVLCLPRAAFATPPRRAARPAQPPAAAETLEVPGHHEAAFYRPKSPGRTRLIVWMHGRGGDPVNDCKKWSTVATEFGWLLCPAGDHDTGAGGRSWGNDWPGAKRTVDATVAALRAKFRGKIATSGNILIGFSEGAYAAQNVGAREPKEFSRWLILASCEHYWGAEGFQVLEQNRKHIRRVYLLTGALDMVVDSSRQAEQRLKTSRIPVQLNVVQGLGHEVPASRMRQLYRDPLRWLSR